MARKKKTSKVMLRAAKHLRRIEKELPATPDEVAGILGITPKRYEAVRKDGTGIDLDKLERLHNLANVPLDSFVSEDDPDYLVIKADETGNADKILMQIETIMSRAKRSLSARERELMYMKLRYDRRTVRY